MDDRMSRIRRLLRDRGTASAIALLIGCLLLVQGLLSGTAQGAMAASAVDPFQIICSAAADGSIGEVGHGGAPVKKLPECPCGTLCRLASAAMPAIVSGQGDLLRIVVATAVDIVVPRETPAPPILRGLIAEPRAPPQFA